jgi:hypothetical protein
MNGLTFPYTMSSSPPTLTVDHSAERLAVFCLLEALFGLYPYAPLHLPPAPDICAWARPAVEDATCHRAVCLALTARRLRHFT